MFYRLFIFISIIFSFFENIFAGGIESSFSPGWLWAGRIFNFLAVLFILIYVLRKPLKSFFYNRTKAIKKEIRKAERLEKEIVEKLDDVKKKMESLDEEIERIKKEYEENAKILEKKIYEDTDEEIRKIKERTEKEIENLVRKGMEELKEFAALKSIELSENILKEKMQKKEKGKFFEEIITSLENRE